MEPRNRITPWPADGRRRAPSGDPAPYSADWRQQRLDRLAVEENRAARRAEDERHSRSSAEVTTHQRADYWNRRLDAIIAQLDPALGDLVEARAQAGEFVSDTMAPVIAELEAEHGRLLAEYDRVKAERDRVDEEIYRSTLPAWPMGDL